MSKPWQVQIRVEVFVSSLLLFNSFINKAVGHAIVLGIIDKAIFIADLKLTANEALWQR
ncbi:hypothetical protein [Anaerobiospirillum succiniciproducens]|uniref:hypothetical protein n=1 Tax=Anaerobiospirillum succiniciproducens TaxID=13335 RepID=UPI003F89629D